ncbi:MAG: response regulator transcription factor [Alistipes sp.]|jgi:DNA-binding LytR/AlgR family response regulator|nr:response regulator transcription factor [Alistipes sp.]
MNVLIIEDELVAQQALVRSLTTNFDDIRIVGVLDSVDKSVSWLENCQSYPDVIFMDVELSDGKCFDIFERTKINCPVIIVTAYNNYAIKAFEVNSIDYLLKPVSVADLARALERCRNRQIKSAENIDIEALRAAISSEARRYKQRYLLRYNDKIVMVETANIAYFYSEDGCTYLMTLAGDKYLMDNSLDTISKELNPANFFRISRSCIVSDKAVGNVAKRLGNRIKLTLKPASDIDSFVSRSKTADFLTWLESGEQQGL